ncbi:MAG: hemolysin family protein [Candidatus Pseudobacter hemicellulosilyticus]|uniref:Hemolysin family protein n=1 Tax=Candidatus Pseudobacter hemicellulosilyticus TaxID=3121375 RepID=A0AAJ5WNK6_9BACT|nr:MAG: hemolysin family protein [Pseudobacter sp.]
MTFDIFLTIFLVLLNGFFVAAEFAIVKVRSTQLSSMKTVSKNVTGVAQTILRNLDGYLAATQLGITLASLGLGWVGEEVTTRAILNIFHSLNIQMAESTAHKVAIPIAFAVITVLHIVFGELAPKSLAIRKPAPTTLFVAIPLRAFYFVFRPFIWLLNGFANIILRILGIPPLKENDVHSEEELRLIISESQEGGAIEESERELIQNVFDFDNRRVREIMTNRKDIILLNAATPVSELVDITIREGYSRYPVYQHTIDEVVGVINTKDLYTNFHQRKMETVQPILRKALFVPENMKIKDLLRNFQQTKQQLAVVTNEFGTMAGIVTMEDILEELVGEIQDEHDQEQPIVQQLDDTSFLVDAHEYIQDINKYLPAPLPLDDNYETLSGLILDKLKGIPDEGRVLQTEDYQIHIVKVHRHSIEKARLVLRN